MQIDDVCVIVVVMRTDGFKYIEETCPSLLSELLETVAVEVEERSGEAGLPKKRGGGGGGGGSSIIGLDLAAVAQIVAAAESGDPNVRRMRRRL